MSKPNQLIAQRKELTYDEAVAQVGKWISIKSEVEGEAVIDIDGFIGEDWFGEGDNTIKAINEKLKDISKLDVSTITVNIRSLGGSIYHGLGIHDILASHRANIITDVQAMTASMGTAVAQVGDTRRMSANALYLIHQPWSIFISNVTELEQDLEDMKTINNRLVSLYVKRSGQSEDSIRELMDEANGNGKWIDADEALEMGLIDEIYEPMKAAAGPRSIAPEAYLNMRLPDLPEAKSGSVNTEEEKNTQILDKMKKKLQEAMDSLKNWVAENFKKEGSEESEIPEEVQSKITELETQIEEVGNQEERITELEGEVTTITGERDTANQSLTESQATVTEHEAEITKLKGQGTEAGATPGKENDDIVEDPKRAEWNRVAAEMADQAFGPRK